MRVAAAIAAVVALLALPVLALGHAGLVSSDPPAGGLVTTTPFTLTATFDEELTPDGSSIVVESAAGAEVATGTVSDADEHSMTAELPSLEPGTYTVRWTAVTADDLAVERGTYTFNVGSQPGTQPASPTATPLPGIPIEGDGTQLDVLVFVIVGVLAAALVVVIVRRGT